MEWDPKVPTWDFAQLDREGEAYTGSVIDAPSGGVGHKIKTSVCSVDLKLGGLGDFGSSGKWKEQSRLATVMASPSGSSKRARQTCNGNQNVSCLVDGCKTDLSSCREYHRRHKVCEAHSKTAIVLIRGQEQRFCQQCSRFHLLGEFDEVKRSCRKRLDGHNRRRRKPQLEPLNSGSLFASYQGPRFSSYPCLYSNETLDPNWAYMLKNGESESYGIQQSSQFTNRQHPIPSSCLHSYRDGKQFPFLQEDDASISCRTRLEAAICQPLLNTGSSPESSHRKIFADRLTSQVLNSDCALSLLSSPTQTSGVNQGHIVPANRIPFGQPLVPSMQQYGNPGRDTHSQASNFSSIEFSCPRLDIEPASAVMVSDTSNSDIQCHGIFVGSDGSIHGPSHALPFTW